MNDNFRLLRKKKKKEEFTKMVWRKQDYLLGVEDSVDSSSMGGGLKRSLKRWDAVEALEVF